MASFVDIDGHWVNLDTVTDVVYSPATPEHEWFDEEEQRTVTLRARVAEAEIFTTGVDGHVSDGGDYGPSGSVVQPRTIRLYGRDAESFVAWLDQVHVVGIGRV